MLLEPNPKIEERIVQHLAYHPSVTAKELMHSLSAPGDSVSLQAIYQELRKLVRAGIVIKTGERYALRIGWMLDLLDLANTMYRNNLRDSTEREFLPSPGQRRVWRFYDLHSLVAFTTHFGFVMFQVCGDQPLYEYGPHVWYHLAHGQNEEQFIKAVKLGGYRYVAVFRGDTFLDRSYERFFTGVSGEINFGKTLLGKRYDESHIYVAGDYVTKIKLPIALQKSINELFESTRNAKEVSFGALADIFHRRAKVSVSVSHAPLEARRLRGKFRRFCGV